MGRKRTRKRQRIAGRADRDSLSSQAKRSIPLFAAALFALVFIVFLPARSYQFTSLDDPQYVSANAIVLRGLSLQGLEWAFSFSPTFYWHPLTWLSHMVDVEMFGPAPGSHHMINVLLHATSSALLFVTLQRMTKATGLSAVVAAFFAVHPLHVESVAWIAERKDVLSTAFLIAALYAYARYAEASTLRRRLVVAVTFGLGLLAKPMIATFPFLLLLLDFWPLSRTDKGWRGLVLEKAELFILAAGSVIVTVVSQRDSHAVVTLEGLSLPARVANALVSYASYMRDMIWPARLAVFYPLVQPSLTITIFSVVLLAVVTVGAIMQRRSLPFLITGWLWFLGALVPVIGIVQAGDQGRADRFTYVPLIGLFIMVVWLFDTAAQRWKFPSAIRQIAALAVVAVLCVITRRQLSYWKDDLALWERAVSVTSGNYRAEEHLGVALTDRGRTSDGITHYEAALRIWPEYPEAHNNLGAARMDQGNYDLAIKEFAAAVKSSPGDPNYRYNLAVALDAGGRRQEAIEQVRSGLEAHPGFPDLLRAAEAFGLNPR